MDTASQRLPNSDDQRFAQLHATAFEIAWSDLQNTLDKGLAAREGCENEVKAASMTLMAVGKAYRRIANGGSIDI